MPVNSVKVFLLSVSLLLTSGTLSYIRAEEDMSGEGSFTVYKSLTTALATRAIASG